jgi:DNA-binding transcriptional regulator LsrR (DeoR family)
VWREEADNVAGSGEMTLREILTAPMLASDIGQRLGLTHEETYALLVAAESRGEVRVVVQHDPEVKKWEAM